MNSLHYLVPVINRKNPEAFSEQDIVKFHPVCPSSGPLDTMEIKDHLVLIWILSRNLGLEKPGTNFSTARVDIKMLKAKNNFSCMIVDTVPSGKTQRSCFSV